MTPELTNFSDWVLALLPRLFLYPGGAWMLLAVLGLRLAAAGPASLRTRSLPGSLMRANIAALAVAWVGVALLPLPGANPVPAPPDRLTLAGLLALSLVLSYLWEEGARWQVAATEMALLVAALAPLASSGTPTSTVEGGLAAWFLLLATGAGLLLLAREAGRSLTVGARWLAWFGLGASLLWPLVESSTLPGALWVSLVYGVGVAALGLIGRSGRLFGGERWVAVTWALTLVALLVSLVGL